MVKSTASSAAAPAWRATESPLIAGLLGRCPRCGQGALFQGFLSVAARCKVCGLSFRGHDSGDGPAVFVIFILGFGITGAAVVLEYLYAPPLWVHAVLWLPLTVLLSVLLLRPFKGLTIAIQYRYRAVDEPERPGGT